MRKTNIQVMSISFSKDRSVIGILSTDMAELANLLCRGNKRQAEEKLKDFEQDLRNVANGGNGIANLEVYPYINKMDGKGLVLRGTSIETHKQRKSAEIGNNFGVENILHFIENFSRRELGSEFEGFREANARLLSGLNSGEIPIIRGMAGNFMKWNKFLDNIFRFGASNKIPEKIMEMDRFLSSTKTTMGMMNTEGVSFRGNIITKTELIISLRP